MHATHHSYAELRRQMHDALRAQNPQWVEPDGTSPICDDYERRFAELLDLVETDDKYANLLSSPCSPKSRKIRIKLHLACIRRHLGRCIGCLGRGHSVAELRAVWFDLRGIARSAFPSWQPTAVRARDDRTQSS
jgi:hypothetical protein